MANKNQLGLGSDLFGPMMSPGGLGADLSGPTPMTLAPAATGDDGIKPIPAQAPTPPAETNSPRLTDANIQLLGRVLTSECGAGDLCTPQEIQAVGSTFINRMNARRTNNATDVLGKNQFATDKDPTQGMLFTASRLLSGQLGDNTGGATNFYSPMSMPMEGRPTAGKDVSGGLEYVPDPSRGATLQNYKPGFANTLTQRSIPGVRDRFFKVYGPP